MKFLKVPKRFDREQLESALAAALQQNEQFAEELAQLEDKVARLESIVNAQKKLKTVVTNNMVRFRPALSEILTALEQTEKAERES